MSEPMSDTELTRQLRLAAQVFTPAGEAADRIADLTARLATAEADRDAALADLLLAGKQMLEFGERRHSDGERRATAAIVAWLRPDNGLCDCAARSANECACGAWDDHKTLPLLTIAERIEAGHHLPSVGAGEGV